MLRSAERTPTCSATDQDCARPAAGQEAAAVITADNDDEKKTEADTNNHQSEQTTTTGNSRTDEKTTTTETSRTGRPGLSALVIPQMATSSAGEQKGKQNEKQDERENETENEHVDNIEEDDSLGRSALFPANTNIYNIYTTSAQRRRRWADVV